MDAQMLARMGAAFDLVPQVPCSKEILVLTDLHVARTGLIKDRTRLRNRAQTCAFRGDPVGDSDLIRSPIPI